MNNTRETSSSEYMSFYSYLSLKCLQACIFYTTIINALTINVVSMLRSHFLSTGRTRKQLKQACDEYKVVTSSYIQQSTGSE